MADSAALRSRRARAHRVNDHRLCRHGPPPALVSALPPPDPDADFDPEAELRALAGRLAGAYAADTSNVALARELRVTLLAIGAPGGDPELAGLLAGFADA
jgi:hypothetical protein